MVIAEGPLEITIRTTAITLVIDRLTPAHNKVTKRDETSVENEGREQKLEVPCL